MRCHREVSLGGFSFLSYRRVIDRGSLSFIMSRPFVFGRACVLNFGAVACCENFLGHVNSS